MLILQKKCPKRYY